jgi:predicted dehydrogenase
MASNSVSRRQFVTTGALALSGVAAFGFPAIGKQQTDVLRVGMIGTGARGVGVATIIKGMKGISLVACCDIVPDHLQNGLKVAAEGAKAYTDYRKLLEDKDINAVIISTPLFLHYPMALDALQAGKHIYLEKSMALTIPQTLDLAKKVKQSKQIFQIGFQYRYYGLYERVKEAVDKGWIGKVTEISCQYNQNTNWRQPVSDPKMERLINWRMYREYCGGPLSELCAHEIDAMHFVFNQHPLKVIGMGGVDYWKDGRDTYDNIRTIYEYPGGMKMTVSAVLSNSYNSYNIKVLGDKGTIDIQRTKAFLYPEPVGRKRGTVDGVTGATYAATAGKPMELTFEKQEEPTLYSLEAFVDCVKNNKEPASNVMTSKDTSIAIHMGNAAADTGLIQTWKPEYSL